MSGKAYLRSTARYTLPTFTLHKITFITAAQARHVYCTDVAINATTQGAHAALSLFANKRLAALSVALLIAKGDQSFGAAGNALAIMKVKLIGAFGTLPT